MPRPPPRSRYLSAIPALRSRPTIAATLLARFGKRRHLGYLRADMRAEPDDFELRQRARFGVIFVDLRQRHAELAVAMAGGNMRMRPRIEIGIHAQADRRAMLHAARDLGHAMQFRARLDVDHQDAGFERRLRSPRRSCRRRRTRSCAGSAPIRRHRISSPTETISKPAPIDAEQLQDAQVGERLHRVADQMVGAGEGLVENAEMPPESARAIDEKGSVDSLAPARRPARLRQKVDRCGIRSSSLWCWYRALGEVSFLS